MITHLRLTPLVGADFCQVTFTMPEWS